MHRANRPDLGLELSRLKSFQRDSVEYVFQRLYRDDPPARRFLVADEVGLGKTMVARGVVAKALDELWDRVDRIDIVYICSNGSIARQNINRLNVTEAKDAALPSRITLLPKVVRGLQHRKVNFISLTPQTSFDLRSSLGTFEERALLHRLLPVDWTCAKGSRNALQGAKDRDRFHRHIEELHAIDLDPELARRFQEQLRRHPELAEQFKDLCERFVGFRGYSYLPDEDRIRQRDLVGRLRLELATSCLRALEPDLIIIDEFQRFKHLLDGTDPAGALAHDLFSFGDTRVLLLSATPYKMYTTADDQADDHYRDFLQTVEFLRADGNASAAFKDALEEYRCAIFRVADQDGTELLSRKNVVERELRCVMVRTERLAVKADRNGMLEEVRSDLNVADTDIDGYLAAAAIARAIEHHDVVEYWKSAPYLLNFMDDYRFKESFTETLIGKGDARAAVDQALRANGNALLDWDAIERFLAIDPQNARMRALASDVLGSGAWKLLWLPPALPYYELAGAYADADGERLTKRLIFSSWHVVPKAVAALLSYEAERRMAAASLESERPNTPEERKKRQGLLRFARREEALANMPVLGLLYPGIVMAERGDPLSIARDLDAWPSFDTLLARAEERVREALDVLPAFQNGDGPVDEAWYWAAPILLDLHHHPDAAKLWWRQSQLSSIWSNVDDGARSDDAEEGQGDDAWSAHVAEAQRLTSGALNYLGRPPADLPKVLATLAVGAPGPVALRSLARISGGIDALTDPRLRNQAGWIAWALRSLFNLPEVATLIRSLNDAEPFWLRVAEYCAAGGLQAVLDEYAHVLLEHEGVAHKPVTDATQRIATVIANALQLRTANVGVDEIVLDDTAPRIAGKRHMRARFAARFGAKQADEGAGAVRQDDVRTAFNSPFWPFVLCSTSVGQEGLDFHLYCHAVVHWNLPSNPVDLEQREGRVHRYKGHAVRKNVVRRFRNEVLQNDDPDPWESLFDLAVRERPASESDLVPFWVLPVEGGARIERHVPALPLSREENQLAALRRSLTVYRMAFGQNRQDDVVAYLEKKCSPEKLEQIAANLRVDLAPPPAGQTAGANPAPRRVVVRPNRTSGESEPADMRFDVTVDVETARELLDAFRKCADRQQPDIPVERFRELLDQYARLMKPAP